MSSKINEIFRSARWLLMLSIPVGFVLIPFFWFGARIDGWVDESLSVNSEPVLMALLLVALLSGDIFLPVPSSLLSTSAGFLLGLIPGALTSLFGMMIGCIIGYWIGATSGRPGAARLLGDKEIQRLDQITERFGYWAIVICRALPVLAEVSVVLAGVSRMPMRRFLLLVTTSNCGISFVYAAVGAYALSLNSFLLAFAGATLLPSIAMVILRLVVVRTAGRPD